MFIDWFTGPEESYWFIDLKTGSGNVGKGKVQGTSPDAVLSMKSSDFLNMFSGMFFYYHIIVTYDGNMFFYVCFCQ